MLTFPIDLYPISNIPRCRFSSRYELPLLVQSVVMNVTMFLMIHLCVKVKRVNANNRELALRGESHIARLKLP